MVGKTLLSVVGPVASPHLLALYRTLDFTVITANSTRKALAHIKNNKPDIIVAEFLFSPTYGSQLSNFEALLAGVQRDAPQAKIIALYDKKDQPHLLKVSERFPLFGYFSFPVDEQKLKDCLHNA
jgi:DNA-binding NtrC family response regulator